MNRKSIPAIYLIADLAGCSAACLSISRSAQLVGSAGELPPWWPVILFTVSVTVFAASGFYAADLRRSRLSEFFRSVAAVFFISLALVFTFSILTGAEADLKLFTGSYLLLFVFTWIPRAVISTVIASRIHRGIWGIRTAIIGSGEKASDLLRKIRAEKISSGNIISGYIGTGGDDRMSEMGVRKLGDLNDIKKIIADEKIEEVIIAFEGNGHDTVADLAGRLEYSDVTIKAVPSIRDLLTGRVDITPIYGTPLLEMPWSPLAPWHYFLKNITDRVIAVILLIILLPVIAVIAAIIKSSDRGPVLFFQERIGLNGKPFRLVKFRSMPVDAEKDGPMLSGSNDRRVTPAGKFLRRHRLDEIPNLLNVIAGDMSLVGPRPEREYFIQQIVKKAPHYRRLHRVKPGITSWGQVKYGYASSVEEMIERMEYDLIYLENMSVIVDLRIMFYTLIIILRGKGV